MAKAQEAYVGTFTLPFEIRWGTAVLPAGDYQFSMPSIAVAPYILTVRGQGRTAIIQAAVADTEEVSDHSQLTIVDTGGEYAIQSLEAREVGVTFRYLVPNAKMKHMAQVQEALQTVSVYAAGK